MIGVSRLVTSVGPGAPPADSSSTASLTRGPREPRHASAICVNRQQGCPRQADRPPRIGWHTHGMDQRVSVITLGVSDTTKGRQFYESLGWHGMSPDGDVVFFQAGCIILALWGRDKLADDGGMEDRGGWGGITLSYNAASPEEVDAVLAQAKSAGATIRRPGATTFWGGYAGIFVDPDGHPWEVAHNPGWILADDGSVHLP